MSNVDRYVQAATRENTRKNYRSAIEHYEVTWGGRLPATGDQVAQYLADYADSLSPSTLTARRAALASWHLEQGFPDPTKAPLVKKVLKGIKEIHTAMPKQAKPLQLVELNKVIAHIETELVVANQNGDHTNVLRLLRNRALLLIGFWRGFRSDELHRCRIENIEVTPSKGISIYLPRTKTDKTNTGTTFNSPALLKLCPVNTYTEWVSALDIKSGPVFPKIDRWGNISDQPLTSSSIIKLIKRLILEAGIADSQLYSSHSLRRGFSSMAYNNGWGLKELMEHVGWKDIKSAMRYLETDREIKTLLNDSVSKLELGN